MTPIVVTGYKYLNLTVSATASNVWNLGTVLGISWSRWWYVTFENRIGDGKLVGILRDHVRARTGACAAKNERPLFRNVASSRSTTENAGLHTFPKALFGPPNLFACFTFIPQIAKKLLHVRHVIPTLRYMGFAAGGWKRCPWLRFKICIRLILSRLFFARGCEETDVFSNSTYLIQKPVRYDIYLLTRLQGF